MTFLGLYQPPIFFLQGMDAIKGVCFHLLVDLPFMRVSSFFFVFFFCKRQSFNLHNTYQVSGGHDRVIHVWDVETSTHLHTFTGHREALLVGNTSETVLLVLL